MDKPKCRLCGTNHWLSEPHKKDESSTFMDTLRKRKWRAKNKNKYNAYMKDFMRKDRAAKKG